MARGDSWRDVKMKPQVVRRRSKRSTTLRSAEIGPARRLPCATPMPGSEPASPQVGYPSSGSDSTGTCLRLHPSTSTASDATTMNARRGRLAIEGLWLFLLAGAGLLAAARTAAGGRLRGLFLDVVLRGRGGRFAAGSRCAGLHVHGPAVGGVDLAALTQVVVRQQDEDGEEEEASEERQRVEEFVVPQVHEECGDEGGLHRRDEHRDDDVGGTEVVIG